jgi:hypothetical protein
MAWSRWRLRREVVAKQMRGNALDDVRGALRRARPVFSSEADQQLHERGALGFQNVEHERDRPSAEHGRILTRRAPVRGGPYSADRASPGGAPSVTFCARVRCESPGHRSADMGGVARPWAQESRCRLRPRRRSAALRRPQHPQGVAGPTRAGHRCSKPHRPLADRQRTRPRPRLRPGGGSRTRVRNLGLPLNSEASPGQGLGEHHRYSQSRCRRS